MSGVGQEIRTANQGCRTNVWFEDDLQRLVLDYKLQGSDTWKRIGPEQAAKLSADRGRATRVQEATEEELQDLLLPITGANRRPLGK